MERVSNKSRTIALLLALFLGTLGAQRFYVGKKGSAIAMLILSISIVGLFVSWVWALVDVVVIAIGKFKDREGFLLREW